MERLKSHDPNTIKSLIKGQIRVEKYIEKKAGKAVSKCLCHVKATLDHVSYDLLKNEHGCSNC